MRVTKRPNKIPVPVVKCSHRYGAAATFSHQSDSRFQSSIYAAELYGFKNNVRMGVFANHLLAGQYNVGIAEAEATGLMRHDIYFATDYWKNPVSGAIEEIPDYYAAEWTSQGEAYFNVAVGEGKALRFPNHGQQMYDLTSGQLGHDLINGVAGDSQHEEMRAVIEAQQNWLAGLVNRLPSIGSYRNGAKGGLVEHARDWIGMRNSVPSPTQPYVDGGNTFYGFSESGAVLGGPTGAWNRNIFLDIPSTFRWWDSWNSSGYAEEDATAWTSEMMTNCFATGGWYKDFCHWHSCRANNTMSSIDTFLLIFGAHRADKFIWTCSMGEAVEYLFIRQMAGNIGACLDGDDVVVYADVQDDFKGNYLSNIEQNVPMGCLNIPLSVGVDLSGTPLAGRQIKTSFSKAVRVGTDKYIVELPYKHGTGFTAVRIIEGLDGIFNTNQPSATASVADNVLTVTANTPVKAVAFTVNSGGQIYDSQPEVRKNTFKNSHTFKLTAGKDYRIGLISEFGQATMINI